MLVKSEKDFKMTILVANNSNIVKMLNTKNYLNRIGACHSYF